MPDAEDKYAIFYEKANDVAKTLEAKNRDYGDSFFNVYNKFGDLSTYIRLADKLGRLENLVLRKEMMVKNEPTEDVLRDMAGYCILTLVAKEELSKKSA